MIAGHFGLAAAVKGREPTTRLWALMLATAWLDVIFVPLYLMHIETLRHVPGATRAYGGSIIFADYTHSLVGAVVLSLLFGVVAGYIWGRRSAIVLCLVVFSHWLLDLIVHRADLPIFPANLGNLPRLGFGLWQYPIITASIEAVLVAGGAVIYWQAARNVAVTTGKGTVLANLCGFLALVFGLMVLIYDFAGADG